MNVELGLQMALLRPPRGVLPFWSRMAIAELASQGKTYTELARLFRVGRSTVYRAIHQPCGAYFILTGVRQITKQQAAAFSGGS
jgi:hypothetical protein